MMIGTWLPVSSCLSIISANDPIWLFFAYTRFIQIMAWPISYWEFRDDVSGGSITCIPPHYQKVETSTRSSLHSWIELFLSARYASVINSSHAVSSRTRIDSAYFVSVRDHYSRTNHINATVGCCLYWAQLCIARQLLHHSDDNDIAITIEFCFFWTSYSGSG